jgi:hypothetical protein
VLTVIQAADPLLDLVADLRTAGWCRSCQQQALNAWVWVLVNPEPGPHGDFVTRPGVSAASYVRTWSDVSLGCFADGCPRKVTGW